MRRILLSLAVLGFGLAVTLEVMAAENAQPKKIQALLITGDDVSPAHNWREISEATRKALVDSGKVDVRVAEDPLILESETALKAYDVIVFTMFNRSVPLITGQAQENLLNFVKSGKGFYIQHLASASFKEWPEFGKLAGRHWVMGKSGHGPRSVFKANVVDGEHPITKGLADFDVDDELYAKLEGDEPIHVLVTADSDWSKRTEPLVFTREYGEGRVVHNAFGHDAKAIETPSVTKLIVRGVEWAATGKVTE
ncbi:MAG: ThuA domain-containing protein [Thermoguttaceae bacterium]|nr:ThuA domain-containing protein [Thermoguttaceae bacterium]